MVSTWPPRRSVRGAAALVGDVDELQLRLAHQQLDREVVRRAAAGRGDRQPSGLGMGERDELLVGRDRGLEGRGEHEGDRLDRPDRDEIPHRIVAEVLEHGGPGGDGAARAEQQRVTVGRRLGHRGGSDPARGACAVFDDDLLAERVGQLLRDQTAGDVDAAAGRKRHDQGDLTGGIVLSHRRVQRSERNSRAQPERGGPGQRCVPQKFTKQRRHVSAPVFYRRRPRLHFTAEWNPK